jgi:hypothetical protein
MYETIILSVDIYGCETWSLTKGKTQIEGASFEAITAVMFQAEVFWVMTQRGVVVRHQHFKGPFSLHFRVHGPLKRWYTTTTPHGVTTQKNST